MVSVQFPSQAWRSEGQTGTFVTAGDGGAVAVTAAVPGEVSAGFSVRFGEGFSTITKDVACGEATAFCVSTDGAGGKILMVPDACRK